MKKAFYLVLVLMLSFHAVAQKKEVKTAEKALKKGDISTALSAIEQACKLKDNADAKTVARILFTKGQIYQTKAATDESYYKKAVEAYQQLLAWEKDKDMDKYSHEAEKSLEALKIDLFKKVKDANDDKKYGEALAYMELIYKIDPSDDNLYTLALLQLYNDKFEDAYANLRKLYDSGYTGVKTLYVITDKTTGEDVIAPNKKMLDLLAKDPKYENPRVEKTKNKRAEIITNMLYALNKMGKDQEAFELIQKAKKEAPDNVDLLIGEANYYLKKGDNAKFAEVMKKAFELKPDNPTYAYNVAIGYLNTKDYDKAREYLNKVLELDPNYKNAIYGLALVELAGEEALVEEINKNLTNDRKYNELKAKQREIYRNALPYLEKYHQLDPNDINVVRTLKNIYLELEMMDKYKEMKAKLKELKAKQ
jgi:tetratricopeptide (TPR) repeat protein